MKKLKKSEEDVGRLKGLAIKVTQREEDRNSGGDDRRDGYRDRNRGDDRRSDRHRGRRSGGGGRSDNEPELYQVYKGRVSRVMEFGCFVQFDRFRGKEGLVHVSQMAKESLVKRDMQVYVKVVSGGGKYSLSMKDVDQNTGRDLRRSNPSYRTKVTKTGISGIRIV